MVGPKKKISSTTREGRWKTDRGRSAFEGIYIATVAGRALSLSLSFSLCLNKAKEGGRGVLFLGFCTADDVRFCRLLCRHSRAYSAGWRCNDHDHKRHRAGPHLHYLCRLAAQVSHVPYGENEAARDITVIIFFFGWKWIYFFYI